jgi:hypothetical protein
MVPRTIEGTQTTTRAPAGAGAAIRAGGEPPLAVAEAVAGATTTAIMTAAGKAAAGMAAAAGTAVAAGTTRSAAGEAAPAAAAAVATMTTAAAVAAAAAGGITMTAATAAAAPAGAAEGAAATTGADVRGQGAVGCAGKARGMSCSRAPEQSTQGHTHATGPAHVATATCFHAQPKGPGPRQLRCMPAAQPTTPRNPHPCPAPRPGGGPAGGRYQPRPRDSLPDDVTALTELKQHTKPVTCICVDTANQQLYTGAQDGLVCAWSCASGQVRG